MDTGIPLERSADGVRAPRARHLLDDGAGAGPSTLLESEYAREEEAMSAAAMRMLALRTAENKALRQQLDQIRDALTGDDYASLPSDLPTVRMAHRIRADHDKFRNQVRDTCRRAETAEREFAALKADCVMVPREQFRRWAHAVEHSAPMRQVSNEIIAALAASAREEGMSGYCAVCGRGMNNLIGCNEPGCGLNRSGREAQSNAAPPERSSEVEQLAYLPASKESSRSVDGSSPSVRGGAAPDAGDLVERLNSPFNACMFKAECCANMDTIAALRHDIARSVATNAELATENAALRQQVAELKDDAGIHPCCQEWHTCTKRCVPLSENWRMAAKAAEAELAALRLRIADSDRFMLLATEHGQHELAAAYMAKYGDSPDNAKIDAAWDEVAALRKDAERLNRIAWLIGSIFVHGSFKAETHNERELKKLLRENGTFWESLAEFDAAMQGKEG